MDVHIKLLYIILYNEFKLYMCNYYFIYIKIYVLYVNNYCIQNKMFLNKRNV